ncbi:PH domain-containing protein [Microbacterium sp. NPDC019599]|uniref:PH domain-containing protein n=1 Tax=Microbacterium sp. NPDC019599 TaxID=3154690 RepID=UPI0033C4BC2A
MTGPQPSSRRVFRTTSSMIAVIAAALLGIALLVDVVLRSGWLDLVLIAPWVLLAVWATYVIFAASYVAIDDDGATVQNLLRVHRMPWPHVTSIDLKWQLEFRLDDGGVIACFGGIVGGAARARAARRASGGRGAEMPASLDFEAVQDRWEAGRDRPSSEVVRHTWDFRALIAFGVLVAWCLWAVFAAG